MTLKGRREFLKDEIPFLIGKNYDRPAPTHVANGFLVAAIGEGDQAATIRHLIAGEQPVAELLPVLEGINARDSELFRRAAKVLFNPDRNVFPSRGAPFPFHPGFVARDASDDNFGRTVWSVVGAIPGSAARLSELYTPSHRSGLDEFSDVLAGVTTASPTFTAPTSPFVPKKGLIREFAEALSDLVFSAAERPEAPQSTRLVAFTRAVHAAAVLACVRFPELLSREASDWSEMTPMFLLGAVPPGVPNSPAVRMAAVSYQEVCSANRDALLQTLNAKLRTVKLPKSIPSTQVARILIGSAFPDLPTKVRDEAVALMGRSTTLDTISKRLYDAVYPPAFIERGIRAMGTKVGLTGPDRGLGNPRFWLETPLLALLVDSVLERGERIQYEDFIDRLFFRFGFLVGRGNEVDAEEYLAEYESKGPASRAVEANHEALRRRLVAAGLAFAYSDSETEVTRS